MNKYKIIAICGKSASGKDTLLQQIIKNNSDLHEIISFTTRPPREGEIDGKHYFFLNADEVREKYFNGDIVEVSMFRDWLYGTPVSGLSPEKINVGVFNPEGISSLLENDDIEIFVVLVQAPDKVRLIRSLNRESNPDIEEIIRRYGTDKEDFSNFSEIYEPEYILDTSGITWEEFELRAQEIVSLARSFWAEETN